MAIVFDCPRCSSSVQVPDNAVGKTGRCPSCQAKLRVPDIPPPPQRMIEFGCPRCSATIRVPEAAAGKKGRCPGCQAKLLVPDPRAVATAPAATTPLATETDGHAEQGLPDLAPEMYAQAMPDLAAAATSALIGDTPASPLARRKKRSGDKAWVLPTLLSAIFFSVAGWWFYKPGESLYAELRYERLEKFNFPAVPMDSELFGMTRANFKRMLKALDEEPVSLRSPTSRIDVVAKQEKVWLELSEGPQGVVYRVDPGQRATLSQWTVKNEDRLIEGRNKELEQLSPKFGAALAKQTSGEGSAQEIANFRDTVLLAQMTGGFGFHVVAVSGKSAYRCAYEDSKGRLYFLLPAATRTFTLRGRAIGDKTPILSGDIIVTAPKKKPNLPGVEEGLEVVREPDADKKSDDATEPPMDEEPQEKSESPAEGMPGESPEPMTDAQMSDTPGSEQASE